MKSLNLITVGQKLSVIPAFMKKFLILSFFIFSSINYGQTSFPIQSGPYDIANDAPITLNLNDSNNSAGITSVDYQSFEIIADWSTNNNSNNFDNVEISVQTSDENISITPATSFTENEDHTTLTFKGDFTTLYNTDNNASLDIVLDTTTPIISVAELSDIQVILYETPACIPPSSVNASSTSTTTGAMVFSSGSGETSGYEYVIMPDGQMPDTNTATVSGTGNSGLTFSGLSPNTQYDAYARTQCVEDEKSNWSEVDVLATACDPLTLPWFENFDGYDIMPYEPFPFCFDFRDSDIQQSPGYVSIETSAGATTPKSGSHLIDFDYSLDVLFTPGFNFTENETYEFSFFSEVNAGTSYNVDIYVGTNTDLDDMEILETIYPDQTTWEEFNFEYEVTATDTYYFAFKLSTIGPDPMGLDEMSVNLIPCPKPKDLSISNYAATSVDLSWVKPLSPSVEGYEYVVVSNGSEPDETTTPDGSVGDTNTATLSGLSANTNYDVYVRSICGVDEFSEWSLGINFTTDCFEFDIPFQENFDTTPSGNENNPNAPDCWRFINTPILNFSSNQIATHVTFNSSGDRKYRIDNGNFTSNDQHLMLISPPIAELTSIGVKVDFKVKGESGYKLEVGTMSNPQDANTFEVFDTITLSSSEFEDFDFEIDPGQNPYFAVRHALDYPFQNFLLDDFSFSEFCSKPKNLAVSNIDATQADLSWADIPNASGGYEYVIMPNGIAPDVATAISTETINNGSFTATALGLDESTEYDAYIRSDCNFEKSEWSEAKSFTTPPANDRVENAINLTVNASSSGDDYSNIGANAQTNEPGANFNDGINASVWFTFQAPIYGNVQVTTDIAGGTLTNTEIAVYSVGDPDDFSSFEEVGFNQDGGIDVNLNSVLNIYDLNEGETYYVQVDRHGTVNEGTFGIEVSDLTYTYDEINGYGPSDPNGQGLFDSVLIVENGTAQISANTNLHQTIIEPGAVLDLEGGSLFSNVLFKSDSNGSGQLADVGNFTVAGQATVERFIPVQTEDTRAFRFLSSAVDSFSPIYQNWQESGNSPAGYGTHITGSTTGADGFDQTVSGEPSMFMFNNSFTGDQNDAWLEIPDTDNTTLIAGLGYRMFIRGDRNYDLDSDPVDAPNADVTLRAMGSLVIGNRSIPLSNKAGYYSLVGNPYQAIVDFNDITTTNVNTNNYYVWDPNMSTRGAYVTHNLNTGMNDLGSSDVNEFIMPGQSFFVQTLNDGSTSIEFTESAKDVEATPTTVFNIDNSSYINLLLYKEQDFINNDDESDGVLIMFDQDGDNDIDPMDATKLGNPDENLARLNNDQYLSIEQRDHPVDGESLQLFTSGYAVNNYIFSLNTNNIDDNISIYLYDNYTDEQSLLTDNSTEYVFNIDPNIPESIATDRFSIDFEVDTFVIDDQEAIADLKVYPNPIDGEELTIQTSQMSGHVDIAMYNMIGQRVFNTEDVLKNNGKLDLNIGKHQSGVYFIELSQGEKSAKKRLIIK